MLIEVYCDGSSSGNSEGPGGSAWVIVVDGVKDSEGSAHSAKTTNNVEEVRAAISGLESVQKRYVCGSTGRPNVGDDKIVLISDSQLTLKWGTGEYKCKKWHLIPLVIRLRSLIKALNVETRWVKGHAGDPNNERCDELAKAAKDNVGV
jgi:ribonuclease HI